MNECGLVWSVCERCACVCMDGCVFLHIVIEIQVGPLPMWDIYPYPCGSGVQSEGLAHNSR